MNNVVYLARCDTYNPLRIRDTIDRALEHIPLRKSIAGRLVIKPNLVMAHPKVATDGYTKSEILEGLLLVLQNHKYPIQKIDIVEKSGLGVTTASQMRYAGYRRLKHEYGVHLCPMEERQQTRLVLEKGHVHSSVTVAREMAERNFLIFTPKLKTNVLSHGYSGAIKLNIGTIDSKERMFRHHHDLNEKIVDLLEIANPDLIIHDGIRMAYGGNQMTQQGMEFGLIAVSANAVAHDTVCASLLGLDPAKIPHIQAAARRGYGPSSLKKIEILGDFPLKRGPQLVKTLNFGFMPVEQFPSPLCITSGVPYCTGGCQGIFLDWLHMIKDRSPKGINRFPKIRVLIGRVDSAVQERSLLLIGDCAAASPRLKARRIVKIRGCPPTHKRIVWDMMVRFSLLAPLIRPSLIWDGFVLYPIKKIKGWLLNLGVKSVRARCAFEPPLAAAEELE